MADHVRAASDGTAAKLPGARGHAGLVLGLLVGIAACGSDEGGRDLPVPRGAALPPLAIELAMTAGMPRQVQVPARIEGHAYLRIDQAGGVTGAVSSGSAGRAFLAPVTGQVDGETIVLAAGEVGHASGETLQWAALRLSLFDQDGDGEADGATGDSSGTWQVVGGDTIASAPYTATITAALDKATTAATIAETRAVLPFEPITIHFAEPVRSDQVATAVRLLAGGTAVEGSFTQTEVQGLTTQAQFQPSEFLPLDQPLALDTGALRDPSGNAISAGASALRVVPDPTSVEDNLGFESGLRGWVVRGEAEDVGGVAGIAPAEGNRQALVHAIGSLTAYIDMPADAAQLRVSLATLSQLSEAARDHTAAIVLHRTGGRTIVVFDEEDARGQLVACTTCGPEFGFKLGPLVSTLDLSGLRGERVWLTIEARSFFFIGQPALAVLVDDLRVITPRSIRAAR